MMKTRLVIGVVCASALSGAVLSGAVPGSTAPKRTALSGPIPTAQSQPQPAPAGNVEKGRLGYDGPVDEGIRYLKYDDDA